MRTSVKVYTIGGLILCVLVVAVLKGWFRGQETPVEEMTTVTSTEPTIVPAPTRESYAPLRPRADTGTAPISVPSPTDPITPPVVEAATTASFQSIDDVLASSLNETQKVQQLFALFPKLKVEDQEEAVQHISNLLPDESYAPLGKMLTDAKLPEPVLDALMGDVLNRDDALKLPVLLDVAKQPNHAMASDAKDVLEIYLEQDYGTDWAAWDTAIKQWLKENAE